MGSLEPWEIVACVVVGGATGWALRGVIAECFSGWLHRRNELRAWRAQGERIEAERLGLGPYRDEPTYLRDQRPRRGGRR